MDSHIQILCRFQKSQQKVPPPSLPCSKKSPFAPVWTVFFSKTVSVHLLPSGRWLDGWLQFLPVILHRKHQMSPIICTVRFIAYSASRGELGSK